MSLTEARHTKWKGLIMEYTKKILSQVREARDELIAARRYLHQHPELSDQEYHTAKYIEQRLDACGIEHRRVGDTGVCGTIRGKKHDRGVIALRADIDALPITEKSFAPYCSQNPGVMHACGHDAHTACLLQAADILQKNTDLFGGEIRLFFQPAEETGGAPARFVKEGLIEGVENIFGMHCAPDLPVGIVGLKPGLNNAAVDRFHIEIQGKSSHASSPQLGVDALYIACQVTVGLQAIVTRLSSPIEPLLIGVGKLESGTIYNAVASSAVMEGTTRTISQKARLFVREEIEKISRDVADSYGGSSTVEFVEVTSALYNDPDVNAMATESAVALFGEEHVKNDRALSLNGDDYAEFMAPTGLKGCYAYLGTGNDEMPNTRHDIHSCDFDIDEDAMLNGAALYVGYAMDRLQ